MDRRIRVVQFANFINAHDFIDNIVRHADPERFEVGVCVRTEESNIERPVYTGRHPRWLIPGLAKRHWPRAAWRLARLLGGWGADILHTHHYDQAVIGWLATRLHPRTRLVVGRHYSDLVLRLPAGPKRRALLELERAVNRAAARIIAPSSAIVELLGRQRGVAAGKIDLVHYGFEPAKYAAPDEAVVRRLRAELGLEGRLALATFGRLDRQKGHRYLLEALAGLRERRQNLRLLIVGDGPARAELERLAEGLGLGDAVRMLGFRRDAMALMAASDVVVQPTLSEAFSQVMVEALWMARPLVMTDVSGATDVIKDGETGLLVPRRDPAALAAAVERLAADEGLRLRVGGAGRAYAERHLSIGTIIRQYEASYLRALGAR